MSYMADIDKPNLTEPELFHFLHYEVGLVGVTRRAVKYAVMRREIIPTRMGAKNMFSKRDGLNWIAALKQREADRVAAKVAQPQAV